MNASLGTQLIQNQFMILTPKMMEELKVLHMSSIEVSQYIGEALNENPLLESDQEHDWFEKFVEYNTSYHDRKNSMLNDLNQDSVDFSEYTPMPISLRQYLISQLGEIKIDQQSRKVAEYIIECIDDNGYFIEDIQEVGAAFGITLERVQKALILVQNLEPTGVGARNLQECILLQLKRKNLMSTDLEIIVEEYLDLLANHRYKEIAKRISIAEEQVINLHQVLRDLDPKPGLRFAGYAMNTIIPELHVIEREGKYQVEYLDEAVPSIKINSFYQGLLKSTECGSEEINYIKAKIIKAIEVIRAIEQRKNTVLSIANFIVQFQEEFFANGYLALKPMTMKMVSEQMGIHESTVSRTVNQKYMQTKRGLFELKFFFSSGLVTSKGSDVSTTVVKELIKKMISEENTKNPLSDMEIVSTLDKKGIRIARRTIAKYRDELMILSSNKRKI